jgi:hypothetical protein
MFTYYKRLTGLLQPLHQLFVVCPKPDTTSLLLGTPADPARSKSELVLENVILLR